MAEVKAHFAPKRPTPKEKIDPKIARRTLKNLEKPLPKLLSDYDRAIVKSYADPQKRSGSSGNPYQGKKTIPQLGEQENQSCPPLMVSSDIPADVPQGVAPGTNPGDYLPDHIPLPEMADVVDFRFELGKPLVRPEELPNLPTRMLALHKWYMEACQRSENYILAGVKDEHFFNGKESIYIEFSELFQLYNLKEIDKTIITCYCL